MIPRRAVNMVEDLIKKLQLRDEVTSEEAVTLRSLISGVDQHRRHETVVREGEHQTSSRLLLEGWAARVKILKDGRRQITEFHLAGDFIDLHSFILKRLDHSIVALTDCKLAVVPHDGLRRVTETQPHLTRLLWLSTMIDASVHREWLTATGRLPAQAHVAHLLCELYLRLEVIGRASDYQFDMPLTQEEIGDACGLTSVHVNRVMQELRGRRLIVAKQKTVRILDWGQLSEVGQFDPVYLNMWREPR